MPTHAPRLALLLFAGLVPSCRSSAEWSYAGETGPEHWGDLDPGYELAKTGRSQSPVDIRAQKASASALDPLRTAYKAGTATAFNDGAVVGLFVAPGSALGVGSERYELRRFEFHSPSEHTIDGEHAELEAHLLHEDATGRVAVVAVLVRAGRENAFLRSFWSQMPRKPGREVPVDGAVNPSAILPASLASFRYTGSLTTPPCTEGVRWFVLRSPVEASIEQIDAFRAIVDGNNRPTQPVFGREIASD